MIRRKRYRLILLGVRIVDVLIDKQDKYLDKEVDNKQKYGYTDKYAVGGKSTLSDKYKPKRDIDTVGK